MDGTIILILDGGTRVLSICDITRFSPVFFAYVANGGTENVSVINTDNNTVITTVSVGDIAFGVAITPDGSRAYVANQGDDNVSVINTASNTVIDTVTVGDEPRGVPSHRTALGLMSPIKGMITSR